MVINKWLSYSLKKRPILTFKTMMAGQHSWQLVKMVINKWLSYKEKADHSNDVALLTALGHQQMVELLLKEKADPNIQAQ